MGTNALTYRCEYSNGIVVYQKFHTKQKANEFAQSEGDHLVGFTFMHKRSSA